MNESETRAELIDPALAAAGWGSVEDSLVRREYKITDGRIQLGGRRSKRMIADYVLVYRGIKLGVIEAKSDEKEAADGVGQAKEYAGRLDVETTFATNGKTIYQIGMKTGTEGTVDRYPTPQELWDKTFAESNEWRDKFNREPLNLSGGLWQPRYYQDNAINRVTGAIADGKQRVLLTMATGTGKTAVAFEIAWKLFQTRWNLKRDGSRRPRILFLADRNILADQAFNAFSAFPEDALVRIRPDEIGKRGRVPTNGSIFFTIFQSFMSGPDETPYFGDYPKDYFDLVIIDECHRGGASDESSWRDILEYFSPAVQIGLTATPKRKNNVDTYSYFGEPVYTYSLKDGINDGFLTPFRVKRIKTTLDEYVYSPDDKIIQGQVENNKQYKEEDFNRVIEIVEREAYRVKIYLEQADQKQKAIVFCKTQLHAGIVRDLINQMKDSDDLNYCCRVTADDGAIGEQHLRDFQDNEKTIPTILTTSQKLSTGVDARNVRNIVLMRPVNDMIEFKQIVGRGTRMFDGKDYFTIYDFVNIFDHFADPEWDGDPVDPDECEICGQYPCICEKPPKVCKKCGQSPCVCVKDPCPECGQRPCQCIKKVKIELGKGKSLQINHMTETSFWGPDGQPVTSEQFIQQLFGKLPDFYSTEQELRDTWSDPSTRKVLLDRLDEAGYGIDALNTLRELVADPDSDLFDVLEYVSFEVSPITRAERVAAAEPNIYEGLSQEQREFVEFVLSRYIESGTEVLDREVLPELLKLKYEAIEDAISVLGSADEITSTFVGFQKSLYAVLAG
ncbi:EcoAI/FtnUII family type I restriction enzme subunit R [Rhodopirellula bahusiensis]|uniref:Restriction endonuclease subunit R n=1 Tax=Rhodopirellula bahusiensis TaxID=2014065 RepID=A0A2G1W533_9BACT|nr:DEAD/DEAH box helicase family protein [Rhodopirellula bahusiensis]PHQ34154.1 restriction endonuclease subunit R [Rhodopirellula bahusiensis]